MRAPRQAYRGAHRTRSSFLEGRFSQGGQVEASCPARVYWSENMRADHVFSPTSFFSKRAPQQTNGNPRTFERVGRNLKIELLYFFLPDVRWIVGKRISVAVRIVICLAAEPLCSTARSKEQPRTQSRRVRRFDAAIFAIWGIPCEFREPPAVFFEPMDRDVPPRR